MDGDDGRVQMRKTELKIYSIYSYLFVTVVSIFIFNFLNKNF